MQANSSSSNRPSLRKILNYFMKKPLLTVSAIVVLDMLGLYYYYKNNRPVMTRVLTRANNQVFYTKIPEALREKVFKAYGKWYGVDFSEIVEPLKNFTSLGDFFTRSVKPRPLPAERNHLLVPADSKVLSISEVTDDQCLIVKDIKYSLGEFMLGVKTELTRQEINQLKRSKENTLYQVIFYLAPGDYHRFHSPSDFEVITTSKYQGAMYPVNLPAIEKYGGTIYEKNERVLVEGRSWNGYLCMALVGAFNVGTIVVHPKEKFEMGEELGMFKLGSTVVMHFEAPPNTKINLQEGQKVRYGDVIF